MIPEKIGRYVIKSELGRGGMSTVYLAHDPNVDRQVAVKLLPREFLHHSTFRERFNREARIIAALEHPAIVPIYDFGQQEGQPFFVMRYMSGGSLSEQLRKGPMSIQDTLEILKRIGSALDHAHKKGIIHRDLKPGNILFDQYGQAYLGDFGIARLQETGATLTGTVYLGTPAYMSPEQVHANADLDGRADIYALGVILFEVLTGQKPFHADTAAGLALKHVTEPVPSALKAKPDLPPDVERVITRAMAKDPDDRYPTAVELTNAISSLAAGQAVAPTPAKPVDPMATMLAPSPTATGAVDVGTGPVAAKAIEVERTPTPTPVPVPRPEAKAPSAKPKRRALGRWTIVGIAALAVVCIGAIIAGVILAGDGDLFGLLSSSTETPTRTATAEPTETLEPTKTATATSTRTPRATATASSTPPPTRRPTEETLAPTLRPTFTPTPQPSVTNTRIRPTFTNTPLPQPTAPPGPTSGPQPPSPPTSPPSPPTEPPAPPTEPSSG